MTEAKETKKKEEPKSEKIPDINPGNIVQVHQKITMGDKTRIQVFEGIVIAKHGKTPADRTITVRKISDGGFGVERIFPLMSPVIQKIVVVKTPKVNRAKLYYLRGSLQKMRELKEQR